MPYFHAYFAIFCAGKGPVGPVYVVRYFFSRFLGLSCVFSHTRLRKNYLVFTWRMLGGCVRAISVSYRTDFIAGWRVLCYQGSFAFATGPAVR